MTTFDAIVIGTGGVGSAALYHLAARGARVLGIDQFPPAHDQGSSHGQTRIIRQAYFEHPDYVPLAQASYQLWDDLAGHIGQTLKRDVGLLQIGPPQGTIVPGVIASAAQHGLEIEQLSARDIHERFPGLVAQEDTVGLFERRAGFLFVEDCVRAHIEMATKLGAEHHVEQVRSWRAEGDQIVVETANAKYMAGALIVSAGAWTRDLLAGLGLNLEVRRKLLHWYQCDSKGYHVDSGFPCFLFELSNGIFYGFPKLGSEGLKVAIHSGGDVALHPSQVSRDLIPSDNEDIRLVEDYLSQHLPGVSATRLKTSVCMYTMSPDEHFIVDQHPDNPRVAFAAGLSGHGFKLTPVLGKALAELLLDGTSTSPIGFLSATRFG